MVLLDCDVGDVGAQAWVLLSVKAFSQFPLDFDMLLPAGFGQCFAAQQDPHQP